MANLVTGVTFAHFYVATSRAHCIYHGIIGCLGLQLEDTSVPSAYIFFLQLPRLRILGAGAEGVYLVYKLALNLIQKRI
jgi:hypothetical protein